ncbi:MAG: hypothetical protein LH650_06145 [Chloroflexi bacterium]|nr:hypothetical protein [Chloroflexota bacterium]
MTEIGGWLAAAAQRERNVVRLEDALLTDRYLRYFWFRLRYFAGRTFVAVIVHAIRVALLFIAFPRDQFLAIILLGAAAALLNDAWWGALERLRGAIRELQRDGQVHRIPAHIGAWLRLALRLAAVCAAAAAVWLVVAVAAGWWGPVDLYGVVLIGGAGASMIARTYHSGAYALRRVYRPLPSLVAVDIGSLVGLLILWPLIGSWAFPVSELLSMTAVIGMPIHYTSRTYRSLGLPRMDALVRGGRRLPSRHTLRLAMAPALASTLTGLDSLLVLTVLVGTPRPGEGASLVALLAALGPVIRAGFEWASLLYFDLVRLEAPLLSRLRERFDHKIRQLALAMGVIAWLVCVGIGALVLGIRDVAVLGALLPLLLCRSLLAANQVRAFVSGAYRALIVVGLALLPVFLLVLVSLASESLRIGALALALLVAGARLMLVHGNPRGPDRVSSLIDLIGQLRVVPGQVVVTTVRLDQAHRARGVTREERDAEGWRQAVATRRLAGRATGRGGAISRLGATGLVWFEVVGAATPISDVQVVESTGGLLVGRPERTTFGSGVLAATSVARVDSPGVPLPSVQVMAERCRLAFPAARVLVPGRDLAAASADLDSRGRAAVLRAGLRYALTLAQVPEPAEWDVSALVEGGALLALFLVPRTASPTERRRWRDQVRAWDLRAAAEGPMLVSPRGPGRTRRLSWPSWLRTMGYR